MIRTVLTSMHQVAAAVGRPMSYLVTYLGQECSAMSQIAKQDRDGPGAKSRRRRRIYSYSTIL